MVPTVYKDINGHKIQTNQVCVFMVIMISFLVFESFFELLCVMEQFSVTEYFQLVHVASGRTLPGVFFFYDLSPIKVVQFLY